MMIAKRKAINFDFNVENLKKYYFKGKKVHTNAYEDFRKFLISHDFEHRQGSGYASNHEMNKNDIFDLLEEINSELDWFENCIEALDFTNIDDGYEFPMYFCKNNKNTMPNRIAEEGIYYKHRVA
jgi:virulence-associated protein VapD